jgi:ABC-type glycerol-3-phosphate transport system permease component
VALREADANARSLLGRWMTAAVFLHVAFYASRSGSLGAMFGHEIGLVLQLAAAYNVAFAWRGLWRLFLAMILLRLLVPGPSTGVPGPLPLMAYCVSLVISIVNGLIATAYIRAKSPLRD